MKVKMKNKYINIWIIPILLLFCVAATTTYRQIVGPQVTVDNTILRWDGNLGTRAQTSMVFISDGGDVTGINNLYVNSNQFISELTVTNFIFINGASNTILGLNSNNQFTNSFPSQYIINSLEDESGSGLAVFNNSPSFEGTLSFGGFSITNFMTKEMKDFEPIINEWIVGHGLLSVNYGNPIYNGISINSGTSTVVNSQTNHIGIIRLNSSTTTNSGYGYLTDVSNIFLQTGMVWESITKINNTNSGTIVRIGFHNTINHNNPLDGACVTRINNMIYPQIWYNSELLEGSGIQIDNNKFLHIFIIVTREDTVKFMARYSDSNDLIMNESIICNIADYFDRPMGFGVIATYSGTSEIGIEDIDKTKMWVCTPLNR